MRPLLRLGILCAVSSLAAYPQDNSVLGWNEAVLDIVRQTDTPSPVAARALAMTHTAIYDAWAGYDATAVGTLLGSSLRRSAAERTLPNKEKAIGFAAYRILVDLFPGRKALLESRMRALGYAVLEDTLDTASPAGIGNAAAAAVLEFRHPDGSNQLGDLNPGAYSDYTGYKPVNGVDRADDLNRWQPLPVAGGESQHALLPHWGRVKGFALKSGSQFRPGPPPNRDSELFRERCEEILRLSAQLTDQHKMIAEFWDQGAGTVTTPGHWNRIAAQVSRRNRNTLDQDVVLFFALTNAQLDASIAAWDAKRQYDSIRPISAIRAAYRGRSIRAWAGPGRGTQMVPGEKWQPYLATPPHGDYVSGHSAFSAASAEILALFTGSDRYDGSVVLPAGGSRIEPGVTPKNEVILRWATFSEAADSGGLSRRLGGIHFEGADIRARIMGRQVARQVWEKAQGLLARGAANRTDSKEQQ